jgi:hypothetical protein
VVVVELDIALPLEALVVVVLEALQVLLMVTQEPQILALVVAGLGLLAVGLPAQVVQVLLSFATQLTLQLLLALALPQLQQLLEPMKLQQSPQVPAT